jgi:hypothetical protein
VHLLRIDAHRIPKLPFLRQFLLAQLNHFYLAFNSLIELLQEAVELLEFMWSKNTDVVFFLLQVFELVVLELNLAVLFYLKQVLTYGNFLQGALLLFIGMLNHRV